MSLLGDSPEELEDDKSGSSSLPAFIVLFILLLPSLLAVAAFYLMLRRGRQRLSVIFSALVIYELLLFAAWNVTDAQAKFTEGLSKGLGLQEEWGLLIPATAIFYFAIGGIIGFVLAWFETRQMKSNPHRLVIKGNWMYGFTYRRTPIQMVKRNKRIKQLKAGDLVTDERSPLGINEKDGDKVVYRYGSEAVKHTLFIGASGSGKTFSMQSLIRSDILNALPTIIIDFKRSPEFASRVASWTKEADGQFFHFVNGELEDYDIKHSEGQSFYDPLAAGTPTSKADMVLGMREYDSASAVYKANMQQLLQVLFSMLHYAKQEKAPSVKWKEGGLYQLASAVAGDNFTELAAACENTPIGSDAEELANQAKGRSGINHAMEELRGQLRTIIASEYGRWMKTIEGSRSIDLYELTQHPGNVILFSLNSDSEPEFARYVGSMIMADLTNTSARRRNQQLQNQVNVYIDEFQAVNPSTVTGLLEKSRESRLAMTLAQQSFEQIVAAAPANGEAYLLSVLDTCSNFVVHNGSTEDSAERLSKILGKEWQTVYKASNRNQSFFMSINFANRRESVVQTSQEEKWVFSPRDFMTLSSPTKDNGFKATAVVVNKSVSDEEYAHNEGALARKIWLIPDVALLENYYDKSYRLIPQIVEARKVETPAVSDHAPAPVEFDYFAAKAAAKLQEGEAFTPLPLEEPLDDFLLTEEEENGDFGWEDEEEPIPDDEVDELKELSLAPLKAPKTPDAPPSVLPTPPPRRRASTFAESSASSLPTLPPLPPVKSGTAKTTVARSHGKAEPEESPLPLPPKTRLGEDEEEFQLPSL